MLSNKELRTCCNIRCSLPASPLYVSVQNLNLSVSLKALERPCLSYLVGHAMPSGGGSASDTSPAAVLRYSGLWKTVENCALLKHALGVGIYWV